MPDPDPNASQNEPQPDAYQSAPAAAPAGTATQTQTQTPAPLLPTVTVPQAKPAEHTAPSRVQPSFAATPAQAAVAPTEVPAVRSTPSRTEAHIVIPTVTSVTHKQRSRAARSAHRQRHVVAHRTRAAIPVTPIRFANSALDLRWPAAFASSAAVDIARPRHVPPGVALAVAAVVLLSGSFLAVAARQVREQVTP